MAKSHFTFFIESIMVNLVAESHKNFALLMNVNNL
jgi:hypothetical protein